MISFSYKPSHCFNCMKLVRNYCDQCHIYYYFDKSLVIIIPFEPMVTPKVGFKYLTSYVKFYNSHIDYIKRDSNGNDMGRTTIKTHNPYLTINQMLDFTDKIKLLI